MEKKHVVVMKPRRAGRVYLSLSPEAAETLKFLGYRNVIIPKALRANGYAAHVARVKELQNEVNNALDRIGVATI